MALALGILASGGSARAASEAKPLAAEIQSGAEPAWVEPQDWDATPAQPGVGAPAVVLLSDAQDRLTPEGSEFYFHLAIHLNNTEGVRQNSEWSAVFSPEYEQVTWHRLRIIRDGKVLDRLPSAQFKKLQRETSLEEQVYTGMMTAATVLEDVRVGDVVEVAYTTRNTNPLMRGHMTARHMLGSGYPTERQLVICRLPQTSAPAVTFFIPPGIQNLPNALFGLSALRSALSEETTTTEHIYRWESKKLPAIPFDENIPPSAYPYFPMLRFSSFRTWSSVVDWAQPLFASKEPLPQIAQAMVDRWKETHSTPEARIQAAMNWVQEDFRYFAMAIGDHNIKPRALKEICDVRFGDCKDKSVLLARLLNELGIEAWPALVNTYWQERIQEHGPGPFAFNHAIVAYRRHGETRWLDPTLKHQQPTQNEWAVPPYSLALILRPDEDALTPISPDPLREPDTSAVDHFTIDSVTGEAVLDSQVIMRGLQADFYRQQLEATTPDQLSKNWFNYIARFYKGLEEVDPPAPQDNHASNLITITAKYRIPEFIKHTSEISTLNTYAYMLRLHLESIQSRRRHWPYAIEYNRFIRHRIDVELTSSQPLDQRPQVIATDGIDYRVEKSVVGSHFTAVHDLRLTKSSVAADHMDRFADSVDEILDSMSTSIRTSPKADKTKVVTSTSAL